MSFNCALLTHTPKAFIPDEVLEREVGEDTVVIISALTSVIAPTVVIGEDGDAAMPNYDIELQLLYLVMFGFIYMYVLIKLNVSNVTSSSDIYSCFSTYRHSIFNLHS